MSFIASPRKRPCVALINLSDPVSYSTTVFLIKTCKRERLGALPVKEGYISLSVIKEGCIGLQRLSLKPCRTRRGLLLAYLGKRAEAIIISPDAVLPSLRDAARAGVCSRVLCKIHRHTHHVQSAELFQNDRWGSTVRSYDMTFTENGEV